MKPMNSVTKTIEIGEFKVTAISDGVLERPLEVMNGVDPAIIEALAGRTMKDPVFIAVNAYLIEGRGFRALVDAGSGATMGAELGHLPRNLQAAGWDLESITHVLLTHIHPDHSNGLIDAAGDKVFPNAEIVVQEDEIKFWVDRDPSQGAHERQRHNMAVARRSFAPYDKQTTRVLDGEFLPGVSLTKSPGHTPGHSCWTVQSGSDTLAIWGDTLHMPLIQLVNPDIGWSHDIDPEMATRSRKRLLDQFSVERSIIAGMHIDFPGFGRLRRDAMRYHFDPI